MHHNDDWRRMEFLDRLIKDMMDGDEEGAKQLIQILDLLGPLADELNYNDWDDDDDYDDYEEEPRITVPHKYEIGEFIRIVDTMAAADYIVDQVFKGNTKEALDFYDDFDRDEENGGLPIVDITISDDFDGSARVVYVVKNRNGMPVGIPEEFVQFIF